MRANGTVVTDASPRVQTGDMSALLLNIRMRVIQQIRALVVLPGRQ